jgi:hypothetical protein
MIKKTYEFGDLTFKPYFKAVGHGFEVGVICRNKTVFVGNFVHQHEARQWWTMMHKHLHSFIRQHDFVPTASATWYCKYLGSYLSTPYYAWLDKTFAKYNHTFSKEMSKGWKQYKTFEKQYHRKSA